jgi:hypothetical protein
LPIGSFDIPHGNCSPAKEKIEKREFQTSTEALLEAVDADAVFLLQAGS